MANAGTSKDQDSSRMRPLHGGRHSIDPDVLAHNQRERILAALAATVSEHGYNTTTISQIAEAASVSKRTFYQHFEGKEDCFLAAYDALDSYLETLMEEAGETHSEWPDRVIGTLAPLIHFLASSPTFARLYLVESFTVGDAMASRRARTADRFIELLEPGRSYGDGGPELADGIEEGLVGGILTLLSRRILNGQAPELDSFMPAVAEFALAPYLGVDQAREVIAAHS